MTSVLFCIAFFCNCPLLIFNSFSNLSHRSQAWIFEEGTFSTKNVFMTYKSQSKSKNVGFALPGHGKQQAFQVVHERQMLKILLFCHQGDVQHFVIWTLVYHHFYIASKTKGLVLNLRHFGHVISAFEINGKNNLIS